MNNLREAACNAQINQKICSARRSKHTGRHWNWSIGLLHFLA